jgi:hypothetical protein
VAIVYSSIVLKRAWASRLSGEWNDDDYDVLADGVIVGRRGELSPRSSSIPENFIPASASS